MWLSRIEADRLRNLKAVGLELPAGLTVVSGRNGQGKSSLLEAVYLLAVGRSFRTRRAEEMIAWEGGPLRVAGTVVTRTGNSKLAVVLDGGQRSLLADGTGFALEAYLGRLDVVELTAERMGVLRGGPVDRRRFLDRGILGLRPDYLRSLGEYRRVLLQRNALLRASGPSRGAELGAWDERLIVAGAEIHRQRREYAARLAPELGEFGRNLLPGGAELSLHYRPSPAESGRRPASEYAASYAAALRDSRSRDFTVGHTCRGPHRDDLVLKLGGIDLRTFGSAGQVRASMVALKLGKMNLLRKNRGEAPLFLMDDFDSDLDEARAAALARFLHDGGHQALVATSKEDMADRLGVSFTKVRMDDGRAQRLG